jgi:RNA polymerase sigma-70 factor, ECF subfamily
VSPLRTGDTVCVENLQDASDATLVVAIGRWREEALAEVYRRHAGAAYALARRLLNDNVLAEEVLQEVFLRLWNVPERFDPSRGSLRAYVLAQVHGRSVDLIRSETSRRRREERQAREEISVGDDIERDVIDLTVSEKVKEVVAGLPTEERKVIELAYFGGHTYRQVAVMLETPEGTVKSRIRSGLRRLRKDLAEAGVGVTWAES